ncbi:MAG: ABC transporter ATP-binding protein [Clostridia bacterium]
MNKTPKCTGSICRMLQNVSRQDRGIYWLCLLYTFLAALFPVFPVLLPKLLISELMAENPAITNILYIVGVFFVAAAIFGFFKTYVNDIAYPRITALRMDYVRDEAVKLLEMDYQYTENSKFFEEYDRAFEACSGNSNGVEGVYHKLLALPSGVISVLMLSVFIGAKSLWVLLAIIINIVATAFAAIAVQKYQYSRKEQLAKHRRRVQYYTNTAQDFSYGKDIRLYGLKERISANFKHEIDGYITVFNMIKTKEYKLGLLLLLTLLLSDAATYGILIALVLRGLSIADFTMYLTAVLTLSLQMTELSTNITFIMEEKLYIDDFYRFMDADLGVKGGEIRRPSAEQTLEIEFKDVSFRYPGTDKNVFTNLNLKIPACQRLAVVGVNGAGKTTLVKLMTGLFKVDAGQVLINGIDINLYDKHELYSMFSVVFQDVNILAFTVAENIAGISEGIDRARVDEVINRIGLDKKIASLPKGIDQMMLKIIESDGVEFSGGENQKLAIARALYKNGNMIIMDEPTAALDALAEAEIYSEFAELVQGKTAVYISHRLASTKFCDCIALFDGDGLAEYGNHDELMEKHGKYYEMFTVQGKYYREQEAEA